MATPAFASVGSAGQYGDDAEKTGAHECRHHASSKGEQPERADTEDAELP
jgi:hypothetical protein